jgi:hypothetical protein
MLKPGELLMQLHHFADHQQGGHRGVFRQVDQKRLTHLRQLEAESIHIIREVAAEFSNPVMMYS